jgi:hypothetical protein
MINIHSLLHEDTNVNLIEIYLINGCPNNKSCIDLSANDNVLKKIKNKYKLIRTTNYKEYYINYMIYQYDLSNDNQLVYSKNSIQTISSDNYYAISYKESKHPIYLFPCINNLDNISEYIIYEFKISNRISIKIREEELKCVAFIEYKHSENVELDKIQTIINEIMVTIEK